MQIHESHSMNLYTKYVFLWDTGWKSLLFLGLTRRIFSSTPCWNNRIHQLLKNTHNMNVFLSFLFIRVDWHQCTITEFSFCYMNFSTICTILWPISNREEKKKEEEEMLSFVLSYSQTSWKALAPLHFSSRMPRFRVSKTYSSHQSHSTVFIRPRHAQTIRLNT